MAPLNPPFYLQAGTYPARYNRLAMASMLTPAHGTGPLAIRPGVRPTPGNAGLAVGQRVTPAMFVTVAAGVAYVQSASANGGVYLCCNDAPVDVAIATAHATLSRRDLIVARVYDAEISGASNTWAMEAITGTPAGSPTTPSTPAGAVALAVVNIAPTATSITNAAITDTRPYTVALGGIVPAPAAALPANPYPGMGAYDLTSLRPMWHNGSAWRGWAEEGYQTAAQVAATVALYAPAYAHDEGNVRTIATIGSFTDYTGQPTLTVTVPPSGKLLLIWGFNGFNNASDQASVRLAPIASGANSFTPALGNSATVSGNPDNTGAATSPSRAAERTKLYTGLNPGATTIKIQARISSGTTAQHAIGDSFLYAEPKP